MKVSHRALHSIVLALVATALVAAERPRISEDRDLKDIDLTGWDCLDRLEGTAKTPDTIERNRLKNRSANDLGGVAQPAMDSAAFLKYIGDLDQQTRRKRRKDLSPLQRQQLEALEKQIVSLTGWLVLAYPGPPESTNCESTDFHDWHLEIFPTPLDHAPGVGDPTGIVCEITPRTQRAIFLDHIRVQELAGFFRHPDLTIEPTGHPARQIRVTGYLMWDDEHNGSADIGVTIRTISANGFHQPWRTTAWEIHPVMKIEPVTATTLLPTPEPTSAHLPISPATPMVSPSSTPPEFVTVIRPVRVKIPYGEAVLSPGMRLPIVSRDSQNVVVKYVDGTCTIPISATDLH